MALRNLPIAASGLPLVPIGNDMGVLVCVYHCLGDCNKNQVHKNFCRTKNKQTHCLYISTQ